MPIPEPNYDYEISTLVNYYKDALKKIGAELNRIDLTNFDRAQLLVVQKEIKDALDELNSRTNDWAAATIPQAAEDGIIRSIIALGVANTVSEAQKIITFNRLNRDFYKNGGCRHSE
jgi:hypothetical protein